MMSNEEHLLSGLINTCILHNLAYTPMPSGPGRKAFQRIHHSPKRGTQPGNQRKDSPKRISSAFTGKPRGEKRKQPFF